MIIIAKVQFKYIFTFVVAILKTGVKPRFLMSPGLNSVFFINRVRVLWRRVRLFPKVSPSVESGFFSSPGFVRVRVRVRVSQYAVTAVGVWLTGWLRVL